MSKWAAMAISCWSAFMLCSAQAAALDCGSRPIKPAFYDFGLLYDLQGKGKIYHRYLAEIEVSQLLDF